MSYLRLPESQLTLYSELLDQCVQLAAHEATGGVLTGSFISKNVKGHTYWYLQKSQGDRKHQIYLGPESSVLLDWIKNARKSSSDLAAERKNLSRIARMLEAGGATTEPAAVLKALRLLAESRVFQLGGVLVGTLAFRAFANSLGIRFQRSALQTQDLDIAHDRTVGIALSRETSPVELEDLIAASGLDLHPVPPLDPRRPSTSFKVRGRDLRIDFLTPMIGRETNEAVFLPAYKLSAQPLRYLDYLLDDVIQAVVVGSEPVLVNLPDPARFALHKLWVSTKRPPTFQAKATKDLAQAEQLIEILADDRPLDLAAAFDALPNKKARQSVLEQSRKLSLPAREAIAELTS
jgi:hypothetical protein